MEYYRYSLMQICKSAEIEAQNNASERSNKGGEMQEYTKFPLDEDSLE